MARIPSGNSGGGSGKVRGGCAKDLLTIIGIMVLCVAAPLALIIDSYTH